MRQLVNIATDLNVNSRNSFYVGLNLRFRPSQMVVRSISYANTGGGDATVQACQVWTNLVSDGVLGTFVSGANSTSQCENIFELPSGVQNNLYLFQVQFMPTATQGNSGRVRW